MSFTSEFKEFATKGNVVDLAVGVIIGGAFGKIVDSLVGDLIMPIIGKILGGLDFSNYFLALSGQTATTSGLDMALCVAPYTTSSYALSHSSTWPLHAWSAADA